MKFVLTCLFILLPVSFLFGQNPVWYVQPTKDCEGCFRPAEPSQCKDLMGLPSSEKCYKETVSPTGVTSYRSCQYSQTATGIVRTCTLNAEFEWVDDDYITRVRYSIQNEAGKDCVEERVKKCIDQTLCVCDEVTPPTGPSVWTCQSGQDYEEEADYHGEHFVSGPDCVGDGIKTGIVTGMNGTETPNTP